MVPAAGVADDTSSSAAPAGETGLQPPALVEYIQADYPPQALTSGLEAEVLAELTVDENGLVVGVEIKEPVGHGFDEAAEAALYQFVFSPATNNGEPVTSKILYRYKFFLELPETDDSESPEPPLPAELRGTVTDMDGTPIPGVTVVFTDLLDDPDRETLESDSQAPSAPSSPGRISANSRGGFVASDIKAGSYQLDLIVPGFKPLNVTEELEAGEIREVTYRLENEEAVYETVVRARRPPREVTRREVTRREITRIPGTGGDALRAIQNLPGMARAPFGSGMLIVRGSSPDDSRYFFDGLPVPLLYHFGGLTSIINSDLLESIDFFPGNYSVRYGGATGGIVEVYPKPPETDRLHAYIDADFFDVGALVESPINENWSIAASVRRSYIDGLINAFMPESNGLSFTVAPRYYDYQLVADYHPDAKDNLRLFWYGSDDRLVFVFGEDVVGSPNLTSGFNVHLLLHQLQARWTHHFSDELSHQLNVGSGFQRSDMGAGSLMNIEGNAVPVYIRNELAYDAKRNLGFRLGTDSWITWSNWKVRAPISGGGIEGEPMDPLSANEELAESEGNLVSMRPSLYGELELRPIRRLKLIAGVRFDFWKDIEEFSIDPRLVSRYQLFEGTVLKGGIGMFHQLPTGVQYDDDFGNPNLGLINAVHYTVGADQEIYGNIEAGVELFYKQMRNLVVTHPETRYSNEGKGKVYGLELLVKHNPTDRFFGWISYTLMKSERIDRPGDKKRRFDFDQTHILTVVASAVLGRGWEAGVRFRLVTGNPDTPVLGSMFDADSDVYWPIYGDVNSNRLPMFHQLDVRVDKNWEWKYLKLAVYIDVQNAYNRENPEGYQYNYDYSERRYFNGLPVIPSLGFKLEY